MLLPHYYVGLYLWNTVFIPLTEETFKTTIFVVKHNEKCSLLDLFAVFGTILYLLLETHYFFVFSETALY